MPRAVAPRNADTVTTRAFLFSDLRGYTAFVEQHGDAAAARLLKEYRTIVRREVGRHAGAEVKTEGDSFYIVFDSASAALECAVAILRKVDARNAKSASPLAVGIGLHAGETVAYDDQFVGSAVNIAARLVGAAKSGEVVISDTLRGLVRTGRNYPMSDRGPLELKGLREPVRAWTVEWRSAAVPTVEHGSNLLLPPPVGGIVPRVPAGQLVCPVLVGREREIGRVREILDLVVASQGQTVIVAGEAGVGKSAFVRQIVVLASDAGLRVLPGGTLESDTGLPYAPFIAAVRSGFRSVPAERLARVVAQAAPDLAQLFPELGRSSASDVLLAPLERHRLSTAFAGLFSTFAREAPILLVLEDLHWADEASLELLGHLARQLHDHRALILATYRSDELHRKHPLLPTLTTLRRERLASEIALDKLSLELVGELIRATFAITDPTVRVSPEFRDAIFARSEGNPFFTEELLKSLVDSGDVYYRPEGGWDRKPIDQLKVPDSLRDAVRTRLERLAPATQTTLSAAAVVGQQFAFDVVQAVRGLPDGELLDHLREGIEQQLIVELEGTDDTYAFRHALTREVIYEELLGRERKAAHRATAEALRERGAEPSLLAHHLLAAGEREAALPHLLEAARRAADADAPREAATHFERAVDIGLPHADLARTFERLAEAYQLFDLARARRAAEEAVRLYREMGDAAGATRSLVIASRNAYHQGEVPRAVELAREAIAALDGHAETAELGRATAHLAQLQMTNGESDRALESAQRAIQIGERFADAWTLANALITKGTLRRLDQPDEALKLLREGLALAMARGLVVTAGRATNNLVLTMMETGAGTEERLRVINEGIAYSAEHGSDPAALLARQSDELAHTGEWDAALANTALIDPGSIHRGSRLFWTAIVDLARLGPHVGRESMLRLTAFCVTVNEGQWFVNGAYWGAMACALADDRPGAAEWLARLDDRFLAEPVAREYLMRFTEVLVPALALAVLLERPDLVPALDPANARGVQAVTAAKACGAARLLLAGDGPAALAELRDAYAEWASQGLETFPALLVVVFARALARKGVRCTDPVIDRVRSFAERVRADWWLTELEAAGRGA